MDKHFKTLTEADCRKLYPKGYFAAVAKSARGGGIVLFILGLICTPIGLGLLLLLGKIFILDSLGDSTPITGGDIVGMIFIFLFPLFFLALGIFGLWLGIRRIRRNGEEWLRISMEASDYPESVMQEFDRQAASPGSIQVVLTKKSQPDGTAILTEGYFLIESILNLCVMKISDIKGAYLVDYPDVVNTGKSVKTVHRMNLAVFSDHWTFDRVQAKKEVAQRLQAMLLEKNSGIDTADGRVLNDREYDEMEREYIEKRKSRNTQDGRS